MLLPENKIVQKYFLGRFFTHLCKYNLVYPLCLYFGNGSKNLCCWFFKFLCCYAVWCTYLWVFLIFKIFVLLSLILTMHVILNFALFRSISYRFWVNKNSILFSIFKKFVLWSLTMHVIPNLYLFCSISYCFRYKHFSHKMAKSAFF